MRERQRQRDGEGGRERERERARDREGERRQSLGRRIQVGIKAEKKAKPSKHVSTPLPNISLFVVVFVVVHQEREWCETSASSAITNLFSAPLHIIDDFSRLYMGYGLPFFL
jgi:hypothetical protein